MRSNIFLKNEMKETKPKTKEKKEKEREFGTKEKKKNLEKQKISWMAEEKGKKLWVKRKEISGKDLYKRGR